MARKTALVINSGSSSIKYQLIDPDQKDPICSGLVERIGEETGRIQHVYRGETTILDEPIADHGKGMAEVLRLFATVGPHLDDYNVAVVGHRIVQGGKYFKHAEIIDDRVQALIQHLAPLAPLHNPAHLEGIEVAQELMSDIPHVAVFDTAFFHTLPEEACTYAIDQKVAQRHAVRRYGAHGTSHQYVAQIAGEMLGRDDLKLVTCHLGNGASVSAVKANRAIDTSMGLTPLEGLIMGTRSGDIDPAAVVHLVRNAGMSIDEVDHLLNKRSGLKGVAGDNDMRNVQAKAEAGDKMAKLAIDMYVHRLVKYIGAYIAVMGGLDGIVFTAGAGENDAYLRQRVIERLAYRGMEIDPEKNQVRSREARIISTDQSTSHVMVIPTNEELSIARQALALVEK